MTDAELRDAAVAHLKKTTTGYLKSNGQPKPPPWPAGSTHWGPALDLLAQIGQSAPPPPPPPSGGGLLGLILNSGPTQAWLDRAATLNPKVVRDDSIYQQKVDWAAAHNADFIGLLLVNQTGVANALATVNAWPTITKWELDNEPYFPTGSTNVSTWASLCLQLARQIKAQHPSHEVILPMLVQANNGDYPTPAGGWAPWADQVLNAQPTLSVYCDSVAGHPYASPRGSAPSFATVDKVRAQIAVHGWNPNWHMTEFGWSLGSGSGQVSGALQAQYLADFVDQARTRSWISTMEVYCLQTWGTGFEESFGLFNQDLSERPAAATYRTLV